MSFELFKKVKQVLLNQKDYSEKLRLKGIFECRTYDTNDNIIDEIHDDNIIVNNSFTIITDLFVDGVSLSKINTLKIGSGGIYNSNVKIITASGTIITEGISNGGMFTWDGKDKHGNRVASGIYFAVTAKSDGSSGTVCKIAMIK